MSSFITPDGISINYRLDDFRDPWITEPGVPILMQHGFIRNLRCWQQWVPRLARRYPVVRYDIRGCGESSVPPPTADWSVDRLIRDPRDLMNHLGIDRVHLVGKLSGALLGIKFAITFPERVASLTLVSGPTVISDRFKQLYALGERDSLAAMEKYGLRGWLERTNTERFDADTNQDLVAWHLEQQASTIFHVAYKIHEAYRQVDMRPELKNIKVPVLVLAPSNFAGSPSEQHRQLERDVPDVKVVDIDGKGSDLFLAEAERCIDETLTFLEGVGDRAV
jgi:3-oxoadipate enol-lactonase